MNSQAEVVLDVSGCVLVYASGSICGETNCWFVSVHTQKQAEALVGGSLSRVILLFECQVSDRD